MVYVYAGPTIRFAANVRQKLGPKTILPEARADVPVRVIDTPSAT